MAVLYVTATPIGNLQDFSPRGIDTLKTADLIIAEDTRVTMKLGQVFGFHTRMVSCHRHNEEGKAAGLADDAARGSPRFPSAALTPGNSLFSDSCRGRGRN